MSDKPLSSLGFANALLLAIALCAVFGTLPLHFKSFPLNPKEIYHTKGFLFLLGVLLVSAAGFVAGKIFQFLNARQGTNESQAARDFLNQFATENNVPFSLVTRRKNLLLETIAGHGYQTRLEENKEGYRYLVSKNQWGCAGSFLVHLGLGVTLVGGFVTSLVADIRDITLREGETISLPGVQTKVRLEKFSLLFYPGTSQPENYVSRLLVEEAKNKIRRYELKVNSPVKIGDIKLFQMRYDFEVLGVEVLVYHQGRPVERVRIRPGERQALRGLPFLIGMDEFIPDFVTDSKGNMGSRSPYFRNPAVLVSLRPKANPDTVLEKEWAFQGRAFHRGQKERDWNFTLEKIKKRYHSGIKFSRDPGAPIAFSGFVFLIIGAFVSSFVVPRRFTLRLSSSTSGKGTLMEFCYPKTKDAWGTRRELLRLQCELLKQILEDKA